MSPPARILRAAFTDSVSLITSGDLVDEYRRVLPRPSLVRFHGLSPTGVDRVILSLAAAATSIDPPPCGVPCPDPRDQHLWDLLAASPGAILVTGESLLLTNPPAFDRVMTPRQFVDEFLPA